MVTVLSLELSPLLACHMQAQALRNYGLFDLDYSVICCVEINNQLISKLMSYGASSLLCAVYACHAYAIISNPKKSTAWCTVKFVGLCIIDLSPRSCSSQVATRRTRTAGKVEIPNVDDHVSKLEHMGKETVKKLQDLKLAAIQAGLDISIPETRITKGVHMQFIRPDLWPHHRLDQCSLALQLEQQ